MPAGWAAAGAVVAGAVISSQASKSAANTQANAARYAADQQSAALQEQLAASEPWRASGQTALNRLSAGTQPGGEYDMPFSKTDWKQDPGYAFRLKEGMKTLNANAAARGGLISGNALRAATAYGQDMGSQEYQNAFNRYYAERTNMMEPLRFLSGQGQAAAAGQASNIGANAAANTALITGAANANAAGQIGSANAYTNAINQGVSAYQTNQLINRFAPQNNGGVNYYGAGSDPSYGSGTAYGNMTPGEISNMQANGV